MGAFLLAGGIALGAGGAAMGANAASKKRGALGQTTNDWLPDIEGDTSRYFQAMSKYRDESNELARGIGEDDMANALSLRETAMPGIGGYLKGALESAGPMAAGEIPSWLQDIFKSSAGSGAVGTGFGGSPFGAGLTGWGSVDRAMGAQQRGVGLLGALMGMSPKLSVPSSGAFLSAIPSPGQRTGTQMQVRGQNMGIAQQMAGMDTSSDVWGGFMQQTGGMMAGAGMMGGMGGSGSMFGGFSSSGMNAGGYSGGGAAGGWGGGASLWGGSMA